MDPPTKQATTFKLIFSEDDIRRISLPTPSWESFNEQLIALYPDQFHPELTIRYKDEEGDLITISTEKEWDCMLESFQTEQQPIRLYISEGKNTGKYFKDGPPPAPQGFYTATPNEEGHAEKITICGGESLKKFEIEVPKCLSRLFPGGKILPYNIPSWLQGCVELKKVPGDDPIVDLDINVNLLCNTLHEQALSMIGPEKEPSVITKAKEILQSMIDLVPDNPIAHYNMACAQSLLGEVKDAVESLRQAICVGYHDVKHMIQDTDLENVRRKMSDEFQSLIALASGDNKKTAEETKLEMEEPENNELPGEEKKPQEEEEKTPVVESPKVESKPVEETKIPETTTPKEEPKPKYQGKWAKQHEALEAMGFTTFDVNQAMLDHFKGDLVKVVNALLNQ